MNKTDWFPPEIKPIHEGPYEVQSIFTEDRIFFSYWNGVNFGVISGTIEAAERNKDERSIYQDRIWRGLKEQA